MSEYVGIVVGSECIRLAVVRDGRVVRVDEQRVEDGGYAAAMSGLMSRLPKAQARRIATIALGGASAQVKHLSDLPPLKSTAALAKLLSTNASRYFIRPGQDRIVGVVPSAVGGFWAAALDVTVVRDVATACETAGCSVRGVTTDALAAAAHMIEGEVVVRDGPIATCVTVSEGSLVGLERKWNDAAPAELPLAAQCKIVQLAEVEARFHVACCASVADKSALLFAGADVIGKVPARWRTAASVAAFAAAFLAWLLVPLGVARFQLARVDGLMTAYGAEVDIAAQAHRDLAEVDAVLRELRTRDRHGMPVLQVLQGIAKALPGDAALEHVRMTAEQEMYMDLVTVGAAAAVAAVESIPYVGKVRIIGPVRRQAIGGIDYDRLSLVIQVVDRDAKP